MSKSMRIQIEVDVHAVTCPGVWFNCKSPVYLSICFLGFHVRTKPFPANFPLLFSDKFIFEKTFPGKAGSFFVPFGKNSIFSKAKKLDFYQKLDSKSPKTRF